MVALRHRRSSNDSDHNAPPPHICTGCSCSFVFIGDRILWLAFISLCTADLGGGSRYFTRAGVGRDACADVAVTKEASGVALSHEAGTRAAVARRWRGGGCRRGPLSRRDRTCASGAVLAEPLWPPSLSIRRQFRRHLGPGRCYNGDGAAASRFVCVITECSATPGAGL